MTCPKCNCSKVNVTTEQVSGKTGTNHTGLMWKFGRFMMICMTGGLWLFIGKKKEKGSTKFKHRTVAICQECGHKWNV